MTKREELANLMCLEDLRARQLAATCERILCALVDATPEDVESARRIGSARGIDAGGAPAPGQTGEQLTH